MQTHPLPPIQHAFQSAPGQARKTTTEPDAGGAATPASSAPAVEIALSDDAKAMMAGPHSTDRPGNSANAPAHAVRGTMAEGFSAESYKNFGQMVSAFVRGLYEAVAPGSETADSEAASEGAALPPLDEALVESIAPLPPEVQIVEELLAGDEPVEAADEEPLADAEPVPGEPLVDAESELLDLLTDGEAETI